MDLSMYSSMSKIEKVDIHVKDATKEEMNESTKRKWKKENWACDDEQISTQSEILINKKQASNTKDSSNNNNNSNDSSEP